MIRAAVLGSPIDHSLSPILHRTAYAHLGVEGSYEAIDVKAGELREFVEKMDATWSGISLTMPLKEEIISIADVVDDLAFRIYSANTLIPSSDGWRALTTDVNGFTNSLAARGIGICERVVILGSGATARAAAAACDRPGAKIFVVHRSAVREDAMMKAAPSATVKFMPWGSDLPPADLTINTTPSGVADMYAEKLNDFVQGVFFESLYNPWPTKMLAGWRALKGTCIDGLDLLVHQGIEQVELMTGMSTNRDELAPILRTACLGAIKA